MTWTNGVFLRMVVTNTLLSLRKSRKEKGVSLTTSEQIWDSHELVSKAQAKERMFQNLYFLLVPLTALTVQYSSPGH